MTQTVTITKAELNTARNDYEGYMEIVDGLDGKATYSFEANAGFIYNITPRTGTENNIDLVEVKNAWTEYVKANNLVAETKAAESKAMNIRFSEVGKNIEGDMVGWVDMTVNGDETRSWFTIEESGNNYELFNDMINFGTLKPHLDAEWNRVKASHL